MDQDTERLLRPYEAAELLGVTAPLLRDWVRLGYLVSIKSPGGHNYYRLSDLKTFLKTYNWETGEQK